MTADGHNVVLAPDLDVAIDESFEKVWPILQGEIGVKLEDKPAVRYICGMMFVSGAHWEWVYLNGAGMKS